MELFAVRLTKLHSAFANAKILLIQTAKQ